MHFPKRFIPGLLGLALAAPLTAEAVAQGHGGNPQAAPIGLDHVEPGDYQPTAAPVAASAHDHKGLLGWRHCAECQRARAKARDGVDVPPPPSALRPGQGQLPGHAAHHGHAHAAGHDHTASNTGCAACAAAAVVQGSVVDGTIVEGSIVVTDAYPPGQAVAGGETNLAASMPPGRAVAGSDPAPVGVSRASQGNFTPFNNSMAATDARSALRDPSVMPTSLPPAQTAIGGATGARPRVISHLLGLPDLRRLNRERNAYKNREGHAAISYGDAAGPVTELPASMVFGKDR